MVQLEQNIAANTFALNLKDNLVSGSGTVYLFEFNPRNLGEPVYVIPTVVSETERTTILSINTQSNDAVNGAVLLDFGQYELKVYRQTGNTLDPTAVGVDGKIMTTFAFVDHDPNSEQWIVYEPEVAKTIEYNG